MGPLLASLQGHIHFLSLLPCRFLPLQLLLRLGVVPVVDGDKLLLFLEDVILLIQGRPWRGGLRGPGSTLPAWWPGWRCPGGAGVAGDHELPELLLLPGLVGAVHAVGPQLELRG